MGDPTSRRPMVWDEYDYGRSPRQGSMSPGDNSIQSDESSMASRSPGFQGARQNVDSEAGSEVLRPRRSSLPMRISSFAQAGGHNSIENFARSWSRAAGFSEIPPQRPSFVLSQGEAQPTRSGQPGNSSPTTGSQSLIGEQLRRERTSSGAVVDDGTTLHKADEEAGRTQQVWRSTSADGRSDLDWPSSLTAPSASGYGGVYGSLPSRTTDASLRHAATLYPDQLIKGQQDPDEEQEPLLIKVIDQKDGVRVRVVIGQSTLHQTVFNAANVLIGVGLLSLPLGLRQSGWLIGMTFLLLAALVTRYTASLLAKCQDLDQSLITFSDVAWKAFGRRARVITGVLFSFELVSVCVALLVLFADTLDALIPGWGVTEWKILCGLIVLPLNFLPLRYLSITSVLGILCCLGIATLIFVDGLIKPHYPGSLREPAVSSLFPRNWSDLPLSFGLLISPWGGHGVFPNIYRDMRHPQKYAKAVNYTFAVTYLLDVAVAVAGYLMFGDMILDEVTSNIFLTRGYPHALSVFMAVFIAIIPLTKVPLNARPLFVLAEDFIGLNSHSLPSSRLLGLPNYSRGFLRSAVRVITIVVIVLIAILVPSFDAIMALLGSAMSFSICIILPVAFHLKLFYKDIGRLEKVLHWFILIICSSMAITGTVWVFLPENVLHNPDDIISGN
ncbi:MAG: hypothetical protein Q9163_005269 [Psora crenata]